VKIQAAATETQYGEGFSKGLSIIGGVQGKLLIEHSINGYVCGAHGTYASRVELFDVSVGQRTEQPFKDWWKRLPEEMRRGAAEEIVEEAKECDAIEPKTVASLLSDDGDMTLERVGLALTDGAPTISWGFAGSLPYVCSPDYSAGGGASSGLIPEAAPLGLDVKPPAAVTAELAKIKTSDALGLSRVTLAESERPATVAAFSAITEEPWPKEEFEDSDDAPPSPGFEQVEEGRKHTRAGDLDEAIAAFDKAIALDAKLAQAFSGRGYAKLRKGDHEGAKKDCEKALALDDAANFQAAVWFNLGLIAEAQGKRDEARAAYVKSKGLRDTKQVQAALAALDAPAE
jgi:tetratricopeptide (TPR) repeat protein